MTSTYLTRRELGRRVIESVPFEQTWSELWTERQKHMQSLPLPTADGQSSFVYVSTPEIEHHIQAIERIAKSDLINYLQNQERDALIDESYYSSKIEGAFSTRRQARQVIEQGTAGNTSERMILNNHKAMLYLLNHIDDSVSHDGIVKLQQVLTEGLLEPEDVSVKYRGGPVFVMDSHDRVVYTPPHHTQVEPMMTALLEFVVSSSLNPLVVASILHFYIGYVHPFFDGNGRTARASMYGYLLGRKYEFFRYFSVSSKYEYERSKYYQAFLDSEEPEHDVTHFVLMNLRIMENALKSMVDKVQKENVRANIREKIRRDGRVLSKAQDKFVKYVLQTTKAELSRKKLSWWPSEESAQKEIAELMEFGIITQEERHYTVDRSLSNLRWQEAAMEDRVPDIEFALLSHFEEMVDDLLDYHGLDQRSYIDRVTDIEITSAKPLDEQGVQLVGRGFITVGTEWGSSIDHDPIQREDSLPFTFTVTLIDGSVDVDNVDVDKGSLDGEECWAP